MKALDETEDVLDEALGDMDRLEAFANALEVYRDEEIRVCDEVVRRGQEQLHALRQQQTDVRSEGNLAAAHRCRPGYALFRYKLAGWGYRQQKLRGSSP